MHLHTLHITPPKEFDSLLPTTVGPCSCELAYPVCAHYLPSRSTKIRQVAHTSGFHSSPFHRGIHNRIVDRERTVAKTPCARSRPLPHHTGYGLPAFFPQICKFRCNSNRMKPHMDSQPVLSTRNL